MNGTRLMVCLVEIEMKHYFDWRKYWLNGVILRGLCWTFFFGKKIRRTIYEFGYYQPRNLNVLREGK